MMAYVGLVLKDSDEDVWYEVPDDLMDRLIETDSTVKLAEIAREIREEVIKANNAVALNYGVGAETATG